MSGTSSSSSSIVETAVAAGPAAMVTEQSWFDFVYLVDPPAASKADSDAAGTVTKERVPDSLIDELKTRPMSTKLPPIDKKRTNIYELYPKLRESYEKCMTERNYLIDLNADVLRQHAEKGFAEVGVHFADDGGVKKIFILAPAASTTTPSSCAFAEAEQGNGSGGAGRSKTTTLVGGFSGFAAIVFALLVVLLSCLLMT